MVTFQVVPSIRIFFESRRVSVFVIEGIDDTLLGDLYGRFCVHLALHAYEPPSLLPCSDGAAHRSALPARWTGVPAT